ncbi:MAG: CRISPR-associated protein Cas4 [Janthinobacterium lividum]
MEEDWPVLISALEHYSYCPRQCALIHVERIFDENVFTLRGRYAHERADQAHSTVENGVRMERALPLWSDRLGLQGKGDVIEFHPDGRVVPVEYKNGQRRERRHDDVQLCAQAFCLEEMLNVTVEQGAVFSLQTHRRREVVFGDELRDETRDIIDQVRAVQQSRGPLPPALNDKRCPQCSLLDACVPATVVAARHARLSQQLYTLSTVE